MWVVLRTDDIISGIAYTIEALYKKAKNKVLISSEISKTFNNTFNVSLEKIVVKTLEETEASEIFGWMRKKSLLFAHGIDLITTDEEVAIIENANSVSEQSHGYTSNSMSTLDKLIASLSTPI